MVYSLRSSVIGLLLIVCIFFLPHRIVFAQEEAIGTASETLSVADCKNSECAPGDFFADAVRESAGTNAALIPAYLLKKSLFKGGITSAKLLELTDYGDDNVVVVKIKGEKVKSLFEQSLQLYTRDNVNFLHVSGFRVTYDPEKKSGERVVLVERRAPWFPWSMAAEFFFPELEKFYAAYLPVKPKNVITVATVKFIAYGPMGYFNVFNDKNIVKVLPLTLQQALVQFVQKRKTISYDGESRFIKVLPPEEEKAPEEKTTETTPAGSP